MKLFVELALPKVSGSLASSRRVPTPTGWKFTTGPEEGERFYRTKLSGGLIISGADYSWLYSQWELFPCCVEVKVNVFMASCDATSEEADELFWPGYFSMDAVRWDHTACTGEVREIKPRDPYDALYRVWETPVNLLKNDPGRVPFTALYQDRYVSVVDNNGNQTIGPPDGNAAGVGYNGWEHYYKQGITLSDAFNELHTQTCLGTPAEFIPGITSSFYFALVNPVTKRKNLQKLVLAGSDAKRPVSVDPATHITVTLKEFLMDLRALHNVYYLIDPQTGHLRLEHYSWFDERSYQQLVTVTLNLNKYPDALKAANNESVDLDNLFGVEELVITNNAGSFFAEYRTGSVRYDAGCTVKDDKGQAKTNTVTCQKIWTHLYAGYANPESIPDDSMFLCDVVDAGTYPGYQSNYKQLAIVQDTSEYPGVDPGVIVKVGPNGYQSAALLFIDFHRYGRSFTAGRVNQVKQPDGTYSGGLQMAMLSTTYTRRQEGIAIPICCDDLPLNLNGYIKTNRFALGKLDKGSFDVDSDTLTLDVVTGSRCQAVVVTPGDPNENCKPAGTIVSGRNEQTYCDSNQEIVRTYQDIIIYADGNCGTYEIPGPVVSTGLC